MDDYILGEKVISNENWDLPEIWDLKRLREDLISLKKGNKIKKPVYDFSEHSKKALSMAIAMQAKKPDISITALHIVEQPPAAFYNQALLDSTFKEALREAANKSFEKLFATIPGAERIRLELIDNHYHNPGIHIQEFAKNGEYDLILMGAQGHSMLKSMLFGSVTEAIVDKNEDQLVLILR
jgi:nucleotide-binding universal stress UspA family protein